jgi:hypothetical protein
MAKHPLIRTIYLYLFSFLGLVLLIIGGVRFLDMALKAFVFTQAESEQRVWNKQPPLPPLELEKIAEVSNKEIKKKEKEITLSEEEKALIDKWILSYEDWQKKNKNFDPITSRRHREASMNLALILIGLPLYLYHWSVIKKESEKS